MIVRQARRAQERTKLEMVKRTTAEERRRDTARKQIARMQPILSDLDATWTAKHQSSFAVQSAEAAPADEGGGGRSNFPGARVDEWVAATAANAPIPQLISAAQQPKAVAAPKPVPAPPLSRAWNSGAIDKSWRRLTADDQPPPTTRVVTARSAARRRGGGAPRSGGATSCMSLRPASAPPVRHATSSLPAPPAMPPELAAAFAEADGQAGGAAAPPSSPGSASGSPSHFVKAIFEP